MYAEKTNQQRSQQRSRYYKRFVKTCIPFSLKFLIRYLKHFFRLQNCKEKLQALVDMRNKGQWFYRAAIAMKKKLFTTFNYYRIMANKIVVCLNWYSFGDISENKLALRCTMLFFFFNLMLLIIRH